MPQQETPPLDYQATTTVQRVRPTIWLAQMVGAASVCVAALLLDWRRGFGAYPSDPTPVVELAAAVYGLICAGACLKRGALRKSDVATMIVCVLVFAVAFYAGGLMYRTLMRPTLSY
jgi:hypothetical protein